MRFAFRVDSSPEIGLGHLMRCLVLAETLKSNEVSVVFVTYSKYGEAIKRIKARGFPVIEIKSNEQIGISLIKEEKSYSKWLILSEREDANEFCKLVGQVDAVVVDHYALGLEWEETVRHQIGCKIVVIDDLVRSHNADIIIDQTPSRNQTDYNDSCIGTPLVLVGNEFALVKPEFRKIRQKKLKLQDSNDLLSNSNKKVLVSFGGADKNGVTLQVLKKLSFSHEKDVQITVVLPRDNKFFKEVQDFADCFSENILVLGFTDEIHELMKESCLAIGAPGTSSWERATIGLPSVLIPIADNQSEISLFLDSVKAAVVIEAEQIEDKLLLACEKILDRYQSYQLANYRLCDGLGANRVAQLTIDYCKHRHENVSFRSATENDIELVYRWQCQPQTRKFSNTVKVPSYDSHSQWMREKLGSFDNYFYIIQFLGKDTGVLRLDFSDEGEYIVSIYLSEEFIGKGIASKAISLCKRIHDDVIIKAEVLAENISSQKLFINAGFKKVSDKEYLWVPKDSKK